MKTITFYSYKGGVGRSLALVNIATRLVEFGKKVCVIDFDLEAPGLHLKFPVHRDDYRKKKGIVDFVYEFSNNGILAESIEDYSVNVPISRQGKSLNLICAGMTESADYWKKLSAINWYELIYENPNALSFFLNLKELIKKEVQPDFLLIDSRTGISEMSGITLSILADEVVIVAANNRENLSGAARIIKSLNNPENNILGKLPKISFVLSRIPFTEKPEDKAKETLLINRIKREYLNPFITEINIIHSDRDLEEQERIKIAYERDDTNTQISIDYLKLFEKLTKDDLSESEIKRFKEIRESERLIRIANITDNVAEKAEYLSKAIELNKSNIELWLYRAGVYYDMKEYQQSIEDAKEALKINENALGAFSLIIISLIALKQYEEALQYTEQYADLNKKYIDPLIKKAILYTRLNKLNETIEICNKMIELDPEFTYGYSFRANALRLLKKFDEALVDIYKALELNSGNTQGILTLAEIYAETGKINEFYLQFENTLKIDAKYVGEAILEEDVYKKFESEERFKNLLTKYGVYLPKENDF